MEGNKIVGIVIVVIILIIVIIAIIWWLCSAKNDKFGIDAENLSCLKTVKVSLDNANAMTREWIVSDFTDFPCKDTTMSAIEDQYQIAFSKYSKGSKEKTDNAVNTVLGKYALYSEVIHDTMQIQEAKKSVHKINERLVKHLTYDKCPQNNQLLQILDRYDANVFDQISNLKLGACDDSLKGFVKSGSETESLFKFLSYSYKWNMGLNQK